MKTRNIFSLMVVLMAAMSLMTSCSGDEDIIFDHERQQFETRADRILLEFIAPYGTAVDEEIYIMGAFNGDSASMGKEQWKLMKAPGSDIKWGIYLDPSTFVSGKTLADGFRFYSISQGTEFTVNGEMANHTDNPGLGTFTNVWGERWESYYWSGDGPEIEHDGYVVYVLDETGWANLNLYMWGDVNDLNGGWPGMTPTGKQSIGGVNYTYFDMGEANTGLNENLIFNNGEGSQLADFNFTIDRDIYLRVTTSGVEELGEPVVVEHDGFAVFVVDKTGWDELALYMWGDVNDLNGGWPGMLPTGEQTIKGVTYTYFDMGDANTGLSENLIFNNNGAGSQLADFAYTIDHDVYLRVTTSGVEEMSEPVTVEHDGYALFVLNESSQTDLALYAWGDAEAFGGWPGMLPTGTQTINGLEYTYFDLGETNTGLNLHLIPNNNNNGVQWEGDDLFFTIDQDIYVRIFDGGYEVISKDYQGGDSTPSETHYIFIEDKTGWDAITLYAWGDKEFFGGWPGVAPTGTSTVDGLTYTYWEFTSAGESEHLIFNNNGGGEQAPDFDVVLNKDYYLIVTADGVTLK